MLRILLIGILLVVVARAFWRVMDGVIEAAGGTTRSKGRAPAVKLERDPVCGTYVSPTKSPALRIGGQTIYFCSDKCRREWERR